MFPAPTFKNVAPKKLNKIFDTIIIIKLNILFHILSFPGINGTTYILNNLYNGLLLFSLSGGGNALLSLFNIISISSKALKEII